MLLVRCRTFSIPDRRDLEAVAPSERFLTRGLVYFLYGRNVHDERFVRVVVPSSITRAKEAQKPFPQG
jgi:hypothetical protein